MKDKRLELYNKSEVKALDKMTNLKKAIALFSELDEEFSDIQYMKLNKELIDPKEQTDFVKNNIDEIAKWETSREYYPVDVFFEKQCEKKKKEDHTFDRVIFAELERERIEGILGQIKQLSNKSFYSQNSTYEQAKKYIKYLNKVTDESAPKSKKVTPKNFPEYLLHGSPEKLANELKARFNTDKGKGIRLMIEALRTNEPQLLSFGIGHRKEVYTALKAFFARDIGSYQSINDCKYDKTDLQPTKETIEYILNSIKL